MADNFVGSSYFLTSRAGEQLPTSHVQNNEHASAPSEVLTNYVSTANQKSVANKHENNAIKYNALGNIALTKNSAVNNYNSMIKQLQLNAALAR